MAHVEVSDAQLVQRCRAGDQAAWDLLVERFSRYVYAIATQAFRLREHDAEDAFQEVFTRVYEHLDSLRDDAALRPWLAQVVRRVCINKLRSVDREQPTEEVFESEADDTLARIDEAMTVHEALEQLPGHCREILDRFFVREESYKTIGDSLELPSGTIASRISRCLKKLRGELEGRNEVASGSGGKVTL